ncbi:MAG TPA: FAD-dependent oxidoreductase [Spirochaetia bacterium]|nr:FAD-dependent oxidoreductase [Spirochaetia bacterium]
MRVAVVGAGVAGLACAVTLERLGVETHVFEQGDRPGQAFAHVGVVMPVMHRPIVDVARELKHVYGLDLRPLSQVRRIRMYGPTVQRDLTGPDLGFTMEVSRAGHSVTG